MSPQATSPPRDTRKMNAVRDLLQLCFVLCLHGVVGIGCRPGVGDGVRSTQADYNPKQDGGPSGRGQAENSEQWS